MIEYTGKYTTAKVMIDQIDEETARQINTFINHPVFTNPVAIMPDCHAGKGSVIGFTMEMTDKIIPNTIGVDIGCGMLAVNIGKFPEFDPYDADKIIRTLIPFGFDVYNKKPAMNMQRQFNWKHVSERNRLFCLRFNERFDAKMTPTEYDYDGFLLKCKEIDMNAKRANNSIGTFGGGNHFIEIGKDQNDDMWLTIHTGSRQLGERICRYWQRSKANFSHQIAKVKFEIELAKIKDTYTSKADRKKISGLIKEAKEQLGLDRPVKLKELDWIEDVAMHGYLTDMIFAQAYPGAELSGDIIETVHNYIDFDDFIIRKGAIASYEGRYMIIPFNMEDGILICEGKSNPEWNYSAPHGAGRVLSRSQAKKKYNSTLSSVEERMANGGIYSSVVPVDEIKEAYKDPKIIEEAIGPTAKILNRIKPILNLKA